MAIQKAVAFQISVKGVVVTGGICGIVSDEKGRFPDDEQLAHMLLKMSIDRGEVVDKEGIAKVELMVSKDPDNDAIMDLMNAAVESIPELVQRYQGVNHVGTVADKGLPGDDKDTAGPKFAMTDDEFLKSCGVDGGNAN